MFKAILISTIFAAAAVQVSAEPGNRYDLSILPPDVAARVVYMQQYGDRFDAAIQATIAEWSKPAYFETNNEYDLSILPADVAARVTELQKHGDRFDAAIRAIFIEAMKPSWGFDGCDHEAGGANITGPQS